jgi:hypothetical protein
MSLRRSLSWSTAMHELRAERLARPAVRPSVVRPVPPVLVNVDGSFNRAGIMRCAHALARRHQISQPDAAWRTLIADALRLAWFEARTARNARTARLAA